MVNKKTKEKCDFEKTYISIYPQKEYEKKDYKIEVKLICGFKDEEKEDTSVKADTTSKEKETKTTSKKAN